MQSTSSSTQPTQQPRPSFFSSASMPDPSFSIQSSTDNEDHTSSDSPSRAEAMAMAVVMAIPSVSLGLCATPRATDAPQTDDAFTTTTTPTTINSNGNSISIHTTPSPPSPCPWQDFTSYYQNDRSSITTAVPNETGFLGLDTLVQTPSASSTDPMSSLPALIAEEPCSPPPSPPASATAAPGLARHYGFAPWPVSIPSVMNEFQPSSSTSTALSGASTAVAPFKDKSNVLSPMMVDKKILVSDSDLKLSCGDARGLHGMQYDPTQGAYPTSSGLNASVFQTAPQSSGLDASAGRNRVRRAVMCSRTASPQYQQLLGQQNYQAISGFQAPPAAITTELSSSFQMQQQFQFQQQQQQQQRQIQQVQAAQMQVQMQAQAHAQATQYSQQLATSHRQSTSSVSYPAMTVPTVCYNWMSQMSRPVTTQPSSGSYSFVTTRNAPSGRSRGRLTAKPTVRPPLPPRIQVTHKIGIYSPEARRERIQRFLEKRKFRVYHRRVKYDCRKRLANACPRLKGRFVRQKDFDNAMAAKKAAPTATDLLDESPCGSPSSSPMDITC